MTTHIVAMGGGGFSSSEGYRATALDRYILSLSDTPTPFVCFVPTASGDNGLYVSRFMNAYGHANAHVRTAVLTLWEGAAQAISRLDEVDVFVVGGGNTVNMWALWKAHGLDKKFAELAADTSRTRVFAGTGAGGGIWHEASTTDGYGDGIAAFTHGLGLVTGSFSSHYDGEAERAPRFEKFIAEGELPAGYGVDNGAALHYVDGVLADVLVEKEGAAAYRVESTTTGSRSTKLNMKTL